MKRNNLPSFLLNEPCSLGSLNYIRIRDCLLCFFNLLKIFEIEVPFTEKPYRFHLICFPLGFVSHFHDFLVFFSLSSFVLFSFQGTILFSVYTLENEQCAFLHRHISKSWSDNDYFPHLWVPSFRNLLSLSVFSLERRWSSRTFRYGYLVTTSPQSSTPPSTAAPLRLAHRLRVLSTLMVWRAVCTRPGNVFTAACWSAITSNSNFM